MVDLSCIFHVLARSNPWVKTRLYRQPCQETSVPMDPVRRGSDALCPSPGDDPETFHGCPEAFLRKPTRRIPADGSLVVVRHRCREARAVAGAAADEERRDRRCRTCLRLPCGCGRLRQGTRELCLSLFRDARGGALRAGRGTQARTSHRSDALQRLAIRRPGNYAGGGSWPSPHG